MSVRLEKARGKPTFESPRTSAPVDLPDGWTAQVTSVAGDLFLAHGYKGVSLVAVMEQSGGSFRDLYREFASKEGLFLRAMRQLCDQIVSPWRSLETENLALDEALIVFGRAVVSTLLSPRLLALHRLILSESIKFPQLGQVWYEKGPCATTEALAALLLARPETDRLTLEDPRALAGILIDSMVNNLQLRRLVGLRVTRTDVEEHVRACVRVFLSGVTVNRGGKDRERGEIK